MNSLKELLTSGSIRKKKEAAAKGDEDLMNEDELLAEEDLAPKQPVRSECATAIRAAMRPYSIAVAPDLFFRNFMTFFMLASPLMHGFSPTTQYHHP